MNQRFVLALASMVLGGCSLGVGNDDGTSYTVGNSDATGTMDEVGTADTDGSESSSGTGSTSSDTGDSSDSTDTGPMGLPGCNNGFVPGDYCPGVATTVPVGTGATGVAVADYDGDGFDDVATSLREIGQVAIVHSLGTGSFATPVTFPVGANPWGIVASDITGDGKPEIATADYGNNTVTVIWNKGAGSYQVIGQFGAGESPIHVVTADFNGDGNMDVATSNEMQGNATVSVMLSTGNSLGSPIGYGSGESDVIGVEAVELNGDGKPDLIAANEYGGLAVMLNLGNG
ncbi:MAG: VCBS repeat-containing protein, partial [Myxococcales bacterium]|nr:VCBS repeat-containing protein [Myxococcales bacterium]